MYQSETPPLKIIPTDLPSQHIDEELNSTIHPRPPWETLPTMYDLPSENPEEPGLPDEFHTTLKTPCLKRGAFRLNTKIFLALLLPHSQLKPQFSAMQYFFH
jgi:hypothetical protein